jgi:hypothetical protein
LFRHSVGHKVPKTAERKGYEILRVLNALIVDLIQQQDDGRVDLLGLREDYYFDAVPVMLNSMTLFIELEVSAEDRGKNHALLFRLIDETGTALKEFPLRFTLPPDHPRPVAPLDPTLFEVPFAQFGMHFLDILVDGEHSRRLFLHVLPRDFPEAGG